MKTQKTPFFRHMAALLFVFALIFSTNLNAATAVDRSSDDSHSNESKDSESSASKDSHSSASSDSDSSDSKDSGSSDDGGSSDSIPLDGGLGILVLGAAAFGIRKLRGNKNDKQ